MNNEEASNLVTKSINNQTPVSAELSLALSPAEAGKSIVQEAREIAERIEKGNIETQRLIQEQQNLKAQELLGGRSMLGSQNPIEKTKEQLIKDEANKLLEGTGLKI